MPPPQVSCKARMSPLHTFISLLFLWNLEVWGSSHGPGIFFSAAIYELIHIQCIQIHIRIQAFWGTPSQSHQIPDFCKVLKYMY
jgi:hypothetical protein